MQKCLWSSHKATLGSRWGPRKKINGQGKSKPLICRGGETHHSSTGGFRSLAFGSSAHRVPPQGKRSSVAWAPCMFVSALIDHWPQTWAASVGTAAWQPWWVLAACISPDGWLHRGKQGGVSRWPSGLLRRVLQGWKCDRPLLTLASWAGSPAAALGGPACTDNCGPLGEGWKQQALGLVKVRV